MLAYSLSQSSNLKSPKLFFLAGLKNDDVQRIPLFINGWAPRSLVTAIRSSHFPFVYPVSFTSIAFYSQS